MKIFTIFLKRCIIKLSQGYKLSKDAEMLILYREWENALKILAVN